MTMQIREHPNKRFMAEFNRFEPLVSDSSSMSTFKECKRKYFYRYVLAFADRATPIYFIFGSAIHKFSDVWHINYGTVDEKQLTQMSVQAAMDYYSKHVTPGMLALNSKFDFMTLERLILSCKALLDFYQKEKAQGKIQVLATEQPINTITPDGEQIGGRCDQIVRWNGRLWGRDLKTTSKALNYYERGLEPNDQFTRYTYIQSKLMGEPVQGQIVLVIRNGKKDGPELQQFLSTRTTWQLEQWEKEITFLHGEQARCRDADVWPQEEKNCGWCEYRLVCRGANEEAAKSILKSQFVQRPWDFSATDVDNAEFEV